MNIIKKRRQAIISQNKEDPYIYGSDLEWEVGILSSGTLNSSYTTYMSTINFIPIRKKELNFISPLINNNNINHYCYITEYNENKTYIRRPNLVNDGIKQLYYLHDTCRYIKISFGYNSQTEELMTLEEAQLLTIEKIKFNFPYKHCTWDDLFYCIDNGILQKNYILGELIPIDLGTGGKLNMQIIAFDADTISNSTDKAPVTLLSKELYKTSHRFNPAYVEGTSGTGTLGGWTASEIYSYLNNTILPMISSNIQNRMLTVKKYTKNYTVSGTVSNNSLSNDIIWIPSYWEMCTSGGVESTGTTYSYLRSIWSNGPQRKKAKVGGSNIIWMLRSASNTKNIHRVMETGVINTSTAASTSLGFPIGFCIG